MAGNIYKSPGGGDEFGVPDRIVFTPRGVEPMVSYLLRNAEALPELTQAAESDEPPELDQAVGF